MSDVDEGLSEVEINDEESDERNANFSELSDDDVDSGWTDVEGSDNSKEMSASELENGFENEIRRRGYQPLPDSPPDSDYFVSPSVDETFYQPGLNFIKREYDALLQDHFSHTRRRDNEFHFEYKPNPIDLTDENIAKIKESMAKFTLPLPPSMECNVNDETFKSIFQKIFHAMVRFHIEKCNSFGRVGRLKLWGDVEIDHATPSCMIYTRAGHIPHLSWDVVNKWIKFMQRPIFQITLPTFFQSLPILQKFNQGFAHFCSMPEGAATHLSLFDPLDVRENGFNNSKSISIWTKGGRIALNVKALMDVVACSKISTYETLFDYDTPRSSLNKRLSKSLERTNDFCKAIFNDLDSSKGVAVLSLGGGFSTYHRGRFAQEIGSLPHGHAVHIDLYEFACHPVGKKKLLNRKRRANEENDKATEIFNKEQKFNNSEKITESNHFSENEVQEILSHTLQETNPELLRIVTGAFSPLQVACLVKCGIDLFDSSFAVYLAESGKSFRLSKDFPDDPMFSTIDFNEKCLCNDFSPLYDDCRCYTCSNYTKGYLHHLVNSKELIAPILLVIHNLQEYEYMFELLRRQINSQMDHH